MKNMKKQTVAVAMATVLGLSPALNSNVVYALENNNPENGQKASQEDKKQAPEINVPQDLKGKEGQKLTEILLPNGWTWSDENQFLNPAIKDYSMRLLVDDITYDYNAVEGYHSDGHYVERSVYIETIEDDSNKQTTLTPEINIPQGLNGMSGQKLSEILLSDGWAWSDEDQLLNPAIKEYSMRLLVDDITYDYNSVEGYHSEGHYVERSVPVNVTEGSLNLVETIKPKLNVTAKALAADPGPDMTDKFKDQKFINKLLSLCDQASGGNKNGKLELHELETIQTLNLKKSGFNRH